MDLLDIALRLLAAVAVGLAIGFDPEWRCIFPLEKFHVPRRLARTLRSGRFAFTVNRDFAAVLDGCAAPGPDREDTWINPDIRSFYLAMHARGLAHNVEALRRCVEQRSSATAAFTQEGEKVLRPLRQYGPPLVDMFQPMPYNAAQRMADFLWPPGLHSYWKSSYLTTLSDAAIDVVVDFFARVPSPQTVIVLQHNGDSAWDRVPHSATAFGHRAWPYNFVVTSAWSDPKDTERNVAWTCELVGAMRPFAAPGACVNHLGGDEGVDGLKAAYGAKLARLAALKAKFDPTNLFRMNHNIAPAPVVDADAATM